MSPTLKWMIVKHECLLKCAIFESPEKIGNVCDWTDECRLIDENNQWKTVKC